MNNNFTGGSINHGNGWTTTQDPRGDIRHYTGEQRSPAPTPSISHNFQGGHNTAYTGRHRSGARGTNRYEMQQRRREARERAEAEEARRRHEAEEAQRRHDEDARIRQEQEARRRHEEAIRQKEHEEWMAKHPLEAAEKGVRDANENLRHKEHERSHAEHQLRESEQSLEHQRNRYNQTRDDYEQKIAYERQNCFFGPVAGPDYFLKIKRDKALSDIQLEINRLQDEVNHRRDHLNHCNQQLHEAHQNRSQADNHLTHIRENIRRDQEAHAAHLRQQEAARLHEQREAQQKANEAAEAQRRLAEATRLKEQLAAQTKADDARAKEQEMARQKAEETTHIVKDLIATRSVENNYFDTVGRQFSALDISSQTAQPADQDGVGKAGQPSVKPAASATTPGIKNSAFSSKQVEDLHKELEAAKKTGEGTKGIYEKYAASSQQNREQIIAEECAKKPFWTIGALAEMDGGNDIAKTINRFPFVSSLNSAERSQLYNFVSAENEATAAAIYQAMPTAVKAALGAKEVLDGLGHGVPAGGKGSPALGVLDKNKKTHQPNQGAVGNMGEFFKQNGFGENAKTHSQKTGKIYQGQTVYKATTNINENIKKGDQFYLDGKHKDHIEVFDEGNKIRTVLNLDGSVNYEKWNRAKKEGRTLPK